MQEIQVRQNDKRTLPQVIEYHQRGWRVIPIPHGEKAPKLKGWQTIRYDGQGLLAAFSGTQGNVGLLLGEPSGWVVDIDLDHPRAIELAPQFLPPTHAVFGRPSKLGSHWLYRVSAPCATHKRFQAALGMIVEQRSTGCQTVMPPSTHPSGEQVAWSNGQHDPELVDPVILQAAVDALADAVCAAEGVDPKDVTAPDKRRRGRPRRARLSVTERARRYIAAMPPAISGQGGHNQTFDAACSLVIGFGLSLADAGPLLAEYNQRCQPPWTDAELAHKLADADGRQGERGLLAAEQDYPVEDHGQDTADKLSPPVLPEEINDPHRLARVNLERYASSQQGRTLKFWRDEWYVWKRNRYRKISENEFRAKLAASIKSEFDRAFFAGQTDDVLKVTRGLVSNVELATSGYVNLSSEIEFGTWLEDRKRRAYISMDNGIIDINAVLAGKEESECLLPHSPQWFSLVSVPYAFDSDAGAEPPRWLAYLDRVLESDAERIAILQEWAGYLLLPNTDQQCFLVSEGDGGNGKSVAEAGLTAMLGVENVANVPLEVFGVRFQLTHTIGKLANFCGDAGEIDKVAEGHVKAFTAGNRMNFDRKGTDPIDVTPTARLMISCNNVPRFSDRTDGIWRRMILIPFRTKILPHERVIGMDKREWWEASGELPAIFNWALLGLARLRKQGKFTVSRIAEEVKEQFREEFNPARAFLKEACESSQSGVIVANLLYRFYCDWIKENGHRPLSEKQFGREVSRCFPVAKRIRKGGRGNQNWCYEMVQFSKEEICGNKTSDATLF